MLPHLASYNLKLCFLFVFVCFVLRYSLTMYVVQGGLELEGPTCLHLPVLGLQVCTAMLG